MILNGHLIFLSFYIPFNSFEGVVLLSPWLVLILAKILQPLEGEKTPLLSQPKQYRPITPKRLKDSFRAINEAPYTIEDKDDDLEPKIFRTESMDILSKLDTNVSMRHSLDVAKHDVYDTKIPLTDIIRHMIHPLHGVQVQDRVKMFRTVKDCFVGNEAVTWTMSYLNLSHREKAIRVLQNMLDKEYIKHYKKHVLFKDSLEEYYIFTDKSKEFLKRTNDIGIQRPMNEHYLRIYNFIMQIKPKLPIYDRPLIDPIDSTKRWYVLCFSGREIIDWLVLDKGYFDSETAKHLMNLMFMCDLIYDVRDTHVTFTSQSLKETHGKSTSRLYFDLDNYYRFRVDDAIIPRHFILPSPKIHPQLVEECYEKIVYLLDKMTNKVEEDEMVNKSEMYKEEESTSHYNVFKEEI